MEKINRKKETEKAILFARHPDGTRISAQETIPIEYIWEDGTIKTKDGYSRTIEFYDRSYRLLSENEKEETFRSFEALLNSFPPGITFEFTFCNFAKDPGKEKDQRSIPLKGDGFDRERTEYEDMIRSAEEKGSHGIVRRRFLTFSLKAKDEKTAFQKLSETGQNLLKAFGILGASAKLLGKKERLELFYTIFHPGQDGNFSMPKDINVSSGLSDRDLVAPSSFSFGSARKFDIGSTKAAAFFLDILPGTEDDSLLNSLLKIPVPLVLSVTVRALEQEKAIKTIKRKKTDLENLKISEQKKASRSGYDMDILPPDLVSLSTELSKFLSSLYEKNERMFLSTFTLLAFGKTDKALTEAVSRLESALRVNHINLVPLDFRQEQGLLTVLPLGMDEISSERSLSTSSLAIFFPFETGEIPKGEHPVYYGINALSGNLILGDRSALRNPNGLIFGTPGSGKSFAAKKEILGAFLTTNDEIAIIDPESEYAPLVKALGGQVLKISPESKDYVNPLDIPLEKDWEMSPLSLKADFIVSLCEVVSGGAGTVSAKEKSIIDRCVPLIYEEVLKDPNPQKMPVLEDLYETLLKQPEAEAKEIATALEMYCKGSLDLFNHKTTIDPQSRILCYDIKDLTPQLKKLGMLTVQDQIWARVSKNRSKGIKTRTYIDEIHLLLESPETLRYMSEIWKRFRKWGGIPTGITQNVEDFLRVPEVKSILENSDFLLLLPSGKSEREELGRALGLSEEQKEVLSKEGSGNGLLVFGNEILSLSDSFPKDSCMYKLMTTRPGEGI